MIVLNGTTGTVGRHAPYELTAHGMPFRDLVHKPRCAAPRVQAAPVPECR